MINVFYNWQIKDAKLFNDTHYFFEKQATAASLQQTEIGSL